MDFNVSDVMRVAMYYNNSDVRMEEMPLPEVSSKELLVKVISSGICGSDVMEWYRIKRAPLVLGHEITGEVVKVGEDVKTYSEGDRVFVSHHVPCNRCRYCLDGRYTVCDTLHTTNFYPGGFTEYILVPEINVDRGVFLLPEEISFEDGTFIEPLACVLHAQRMVNLRAGQSVLVIGSGISGLLHIRLAKALGAARIFATDISEYRLNMAKISGAHASMNAEEGVPERLKQLNDGRLVDLVIVCTGATSVIDQALKSVDRGGTILFFAPSKPDVTIPLPLNDFWRNEITVTTSYAASPSDIITSIGLLQSKRVEVSDLITHRLSLSEAGEGFKLVESGGESVKVIIEPQR
ncbi:MAG: zinc-dependent dehydrogenase [Halobacteriota archaeon]|nr:zinc-dependent dehydrogenase [Halobacteriota archaeon]